MSCYITFDKYIIACPRHSTSFNVSAYTDEEKERGFNITCPKNANSKQHAFIQREAFGYIPSVTGVHYPNATSLTLYQD